MNPDGKRKDPKLIKQYADYCRSRPCMCCDNEGTQVCHILRGGKRTDEWWNVCWLCADCHREFDSKGEKTRVWMFTNKIRIGEAKVEDILEAHRRFGFYYE